jgi:hypothetical protein
MGYIDTAYSQSDQLSWMWDCILLLPFATSQINFRVESIDIPSFQLELERKYSNEIFIKSIKQPDECSISFRESSKFHVYDSLQKWIGEYYDDDKKVLRTFSSKEEYDGFKGNIELVYFRPALTSFQPPIEVMRFRLLGCLPIGITPISATYSDGDALKVSFSFLPEKVEFERKRF